MNFLNGAIVGDAAPGQWVFRSDGGVEVGVPPSRFDVTAGSRVTLGIRQNHMRVSPDEAGIPVRVRTVEHLGGETFVYGDVPGNERVTVQLPGQSDVTAGARPTFRVETSELHLFDHRSGRSLRRTDAARGVQR